MSGAVCCAALPEAARDYIGNRRVDEVECIIGDIAGVARGKAREVVFDIVETPATRASRPFSCRASSSWYQRRSR